MWRHSTIRRVVRLTSLSLDDPTARALERALNEEIVVRYAADEPEEPHDATQFAPPSGAFVVAWLQVDGGDELPVACGGIRRLDDQRCELKRMYVVPEARGRGISRQLLGRLEDEAAALGYDAVWLETGTEQPEAIALYESSGYELVENFGRYKDEPKVRSFAKSLTP